MGRRPKTSPAEDAIILATAGKSADATNERLVEAGFAPLPPRQIRSRRYTLQKTDPPAAGPDAEEPWSRDSEMQQLFKRRATLTWKMEHLENEYLFSRQALEREIEEVTEAIHRSLLGDSTHQVPPD